MWSQTHVRKLFVLFGNLISIFVHLTKVTVRGLHIEGAHSSDALLETVLMYVPSYAHRVPRQSGPRMILLHISQHWVLSAAAGRAVLLIKSSTTVAVL